MLKANKFIELTDTVRRKELEKQKRIQSDMKLVEDALNDLYMKIEKNMELGVNVPKYISVPKILEKEVQDNLVLEQGYFLDVDKRGNTKIYYNKEDFDSRTKECLNIPYFNYDGKELSAMENTIINDEEPKKEDTKFIRYFKDDDKNLADLLAKIAIHNYLYKNKKVRG
jgi:hypothetical protein